MGNDGPQPVVPGFQVGFNYPWAFDDYGQNFGPIFFVPPEGQGLPRWKKTLPERLKDLEFLGIKIVRWFILMNGLTYGKITVDSQGIIQTMQAPKERIPVEKVVVGPRGVRLHFIGSGWAFEPPAQLDPLFIDHFRQMLQAFRDRNLQVIPSLVDFPFFAMPPLHLPFDSTRLLAPRDPNSGGGRTDIMTDPTKRRHFFDTVLEPLLQVSVPFKDQIFAWEVMNEPSWLINTLTPVDNDPTMNQTVLTTFLQEGLDRIHNHPEFAQKSTVGHRFHSDLSKFPTGRIPQFHYYAKFFDDNTIPPAGGNKFIGEFAPDVNTLLFASIRADQAAPWSELSGADNDVFNKLQLLASKGYKMAMIWPDEKGAGDRLKLSGPAQQSLRRFTFGPRGGHGSSDDF